MKLSFEFMLLSFLTEFCLCWRETPLRLKIKQGIVEGVTFKTENSRLRIFYGIPYAAAPVGSLRFSPPVLHQGWNGTYQAFNPKPRCPQLPLNEADNEDCLYLDVWIPDMNPTFLKPVVVYFGGVNFARDSMLPFNGQDLASRGIIVVRVSYRLNIFGFLSLGNRELRGNLGLLDQYYAMIWVRENIVHFGGDSRNVNLLGHLSGATSIALHMTSPRTNGLFQKALLFSGSAVAPWISDTNTIEISKQIVRFLKCESNTMNCLRTSSAAVLLKALEMFTESVNKTNMLSPITDAFLPVDERYLPVSATDSFRDGGFLQMPTMIGVGRVVKYSEIDLWINLLSQGYLFLQKFVRIVKIPEILELYQVNENMKELISSLIEWHYSFFIDLDGKFLIDQLKKLEYEAKIEAPVFQQIFFMCQKPNNPTYVFSVEEVDLNSDAEDESVTMDIALLLGSSMLRKINKKRLNNRENLIGERMQEYVSNFISSGNPTANGRQPWRKYVLHDPYVRVFQANQHTIESRLQQKRISFWNELIDKFHFTEYKFNQPSISVASANLGTATRIRNIILCGLLVFLLILLVICIILLRRKSRMMRTNSSWTVG